MMRVLGLMSGTSVDAIDVALAGFVWSGDVLEMTLLGCSEWAWPPPVRRRILAALPPSLTSAQELNRLDVAVGECFSAAAVAGIDELGAGACDLVVSHGQTIHHDVVDGQAFGSLQLGRAAVIAEGTGLPVLADLRSRDIAAGGQGAPLVPVLDALLLAGRGAPAGCLNLGGIANLTAVRPDAEVVAFDVGPANALLDLAVGHASGGLQRHDAGGSLALRGRVDQRLLSYLLADPYLREPPPRSTGKERYHAQYLAAALENAPVARLEDQLATLTAAAAGPIVEAVATYGLRTVYVSGGGVHNRALMEQLREGLDRAGCTLERTEALGMPADGKEAYAMALIGWLSSQGLPGNLPAATGARGPRQLGNLTSGPAGWPTGEAAGPLTTAPTALRITAV